MKKKYKFIIGGIFAVVIIIIYIISVNSGIDVETITVIEQDAKLYFVTDGIAKSGEIMSIYPKVQGEVLSVNVNEGDIVKKGQLIATINAPDIDLQLKSIDKSIEQLKVKQSQEVIDENNRVETIQNQMNAIDLQKDALELQQKQGNIDIDEKISLQNRALEKTIDEYNSQKVQVEKAEILYQNGVISESEYKAQKDLLKSFEYGVSTNEKQLEGIKNGTITNDDFYKNSIEQLKSQKDILSKSASNNSSNINKLYELQISELENQKQIIQNNFQSGEILSPIDGVINNINIKNVNYVYPQTEIAKITPNDDLILVTHISTRDDDSVKLSDKVEIIVDKREKDIVLNGEIVHIANEAKEIVSNLGVSESKIEVKIKPENNDVLKPGYKADINFLLYNEPNKIVLPNESLWKSEGKDYVWTVKNGKLSQTEIIVLCELRNDVVIEEGVSVNDVVVLNADNELLKNGKKVK